MGRLGPGVRRTRQVQAPPDGVWPPGGTRPPGVDAGNRARGEKASHQRGGYVLRKRIHEPTPRADGGGGGLFGEDESPVVAEGGVPAGFRLFDNRKRGNQKSPHAQEDARQARSCRRKTGGLSSAALGRRAERGAAGGGRRRRGRWVCAPRPSLRQRLGAPSGLMGRCEGRVWPQLGRLKCVCGRDGPAGAGKGQSHHVT